MIFEYIVRDTKGKKVKGTQEATTREEAVKVLQSRGLFILRVYPFKQPVMTSSEEEKIKRRLFTHRGIKQADLILFARQMATMLEAGVSLVRALDIILKQTTSKNFYDMVLNIRNDIEQGLSFSESLRKYQKYFSSLWISLAETGEASGNLALSLERLATYLEERAEFRRKVITSLMYPLIITLVAVMALLFFTLKIVPTFSRIFMQFEIEMPGPTKVLIAISDFLLRFGWILLFVVPVACFFLYKYIKTGGKEYFDRIVLKLPMLGTFLKELSIERFSAEMKTLLESGVPIVYSLEMVERSVMNVVLRDIMTQIKESVKRGRTLSEIIEKFEYFPPMVTQLIKIGEEVGDLSGMFAKVNKFYSQLIETKVTRILALFEPVMIVIMGVIIGGMVISMYLPIFKLATLGTS